MNDPPEEGDGHDYDMIAFSLAQGDGFGNYWSNPQWRAPYQKFNRDDRYAPLLERSGEYTATAYRPPLLPLILAAIYKAAGRQFWLWRVISAALVSVAVMMAVYLAERLSGRFAAYACVVLAISDRLLLFYSTTFMTEGLAAVLLTYFVYLTCRRGSLMSSKPAISAGLVLALLAYARNVWALEAPFLVTAVFLLVCRDLGARCAAKKALVLMSSFLLFLAPLILWNCIRLGAFMPFGTQAGVNSVSAFSNESFDARGLWTSQPETKANTQCNNRISTGTTGLEREADCARITRSIADNWISAHYSSLPLLSFYKVRSLLWTDARLFQRFLILASGAGFLFLRHRREFWILILPLVSTIIATAISWSIGGGRFLLPVHPCLYVLTSSSFARLLSRFARKNPQIAANQSSAVEQSYSRAPSGHEFENR